MGRVTIIVQSIYGSERVLPTHARIFLEHNAIEYLMQRKHSVQSPIECSEALYSRDVTHFLCPIHQVGAVKLQKSSIC